MWKKEKWELWTQEREEEERRRHAESGRFVDLLKGQGHEIFLVLFDVN